MREVYPCPFCEGAGFTFQKDLDVVPVVRCKNCKHYEEDHFATLNGIPIITAHNICTFWGKGCLTKADGFCFAGEVDDGVDKSL